MIDVTVFESIVGMLQALKISFEIIDHPPVYTIEDVLGVLPLKLDEMAKTIVMLLNRSDLVAVVIPGSSRVDYSKVAKVLGVSRNMIKFADKSEVEKTGMAIGSISPLHNCFAKVIVDSRLLKKERVFCGSGDLKKTISISPATIVEINKAIIADVSTHRKGWV